MAKLFNRAKMDTSTTGSGTITLGSAVDGYQSFADAGVSDSDVVQYVIEDGTSWEIGTGTYSSSGTSLTRTPSESSNSGAAISLTGAAEVFITAVADDLNRLQNAGSTKVEATSTGATVTGNLAVTGTVDGRDVAADGTKLDGIEANADVTDTANVTAAGALMDSEVTNLAQVKAFDSSDYVSVTGDTITSGTSTGLTINHDTFANGLVLERNHTTNSPALTFTNLTGQAGILHASQSSGALYWRELSNTTNQRVFHDNYHPNADTWTTARTLSLTGDVTGSVSIDGSANASITTTVGNDSHTHTFDNLTSKTSGTGDYATTGDLQSGKNSGGVALTVNDGYGNANVTFNHRNGTPEQNGNAARIEVNTDSSSGANMNFEVKSGVTSGTAVQTTSILNLSETQVTAYQTLYENSNRVFTDGYHPNADAWTTSRTLSLTGEVTGSVSWDGSANASISTTLTESPNFSTSLTVDGHTLQDSSDRSGLLELSTSLGSWRGIQIRPTSTSRWSVMGDQDDFGLYDDYNSEWILLYNENSTLQLYSNGTNGLTVGGSYVEVPSQIRHMGDTNTYMQFHAADQWRVVTGGVERLEVNNSQITSAEPIHAPSFHGDGSALTGISASGGIQARAIYNSTGTQAFYDEAGFSSLTDGGTGQSTLGFDTAKPNANYAHVCGAGDASAGAVRIPIIHEGNNSTTSCWHRLENASSSATDGEYVSLMILGD